MEKIVLIAGCVPRIAVPVISNEADKRTRATAANVFELKERFPLSQKPSPFAKAVVKHDFNCASLATKHGCDVVASGSALCALLATIEGKFLRDIYLPIQINEYDVIDGRGTHCRRLLYLNKPYKPITLTAQDTNHLYHKTGLKFTLYVKTGDVYQASTSMPKTRHFRNRKFKDYKNKSELVDRNDESREMNLEDDLFGSSVTNLETFGTETNGAKEKNEKSSESVLETSSEKFGDGFGMRSGEDRGQGSGRKRPLSGATSPARKARVGLFDMVSGNRSAAILDENEGRAKSKSRDRSCGRSRDEAKASSALDDILASQTKLLQATGEKPEKPKVKLELENSAEYIQWRRPHASTYSVWNLGQIRLLIRSNHHGNVRDVSTNKVKELYLSPKMEYQPTLGGEVLTLNECIDTYNQSLIRNCSHTLRARIHAFTSEVMMLEGLEHGALLPQGCPYVPKHAHHTLHNLLTRLMELPSGQFLLKCDEGSGMVQILEPVPKSNQAEFNLREIMETAGRLVSEAPPRWLPVDPEVEMPYHHFFKRIPATFPPIDGIKPQHIFSKNKKKRKKAKK